VGEEQQIKVLLFKDENSIRIINKEMTSLIVGK
jgi:hypothetical protein